MISNYIFYLYALPKEEQIEQILMILVFFLISAIVCVFLDYIKSKFSNKHKIS